MAKNKRWPASPTEDYEAGRYDSVLMLYEEQNNSRAQLILKGRSVARLIWHV
jgi:hypothetical protein